MIEELTKETEKSYYVFIIGDKEFLIPKESVIQVLEIIRIFPLPGSPDYMVGALPKKGRIIPAIDFAKVYNIERLNYSESKFVIIVDIKGEKIGILSDTPPFTVNFEQEIVVENIIEPEKLFENLKISRTKKSNEGA